VFIIYKARLHIAGGNMAKLSIVDALSVDAKLLLEVTHDERIAV
jgi:hypothetical protein